MPPRPPLSRDAASALALKALAFLLGEETALSRFLALTGTSPEQLTRDIAQTSLHLAILDHFLGDESLLLTFCATEALHPSMIEAARRALAEGSP